MLFSSIIPISLRINLDFAKLYYAHEINNDQKIQGCQTRVGNVVEDLGRIEYLLTDKTGTLTKNEMIFQKLYIDQGDNYTHEDIEKLKEKVLKYFK